MSDLSDNHNEISSAIKEEITEQVNTSLNQWLEATRGLPITLQLIELGFSWISSLEQAYIRWTQSEDNRK